MTDYDYQERHFKGNVIAFKVLVSAASKMSAAFESRCGWTITVNDTDIEVLLLVKLRSRTRANGIEAPRGFPAPKSTIASVVVELWPPIFVLFDGQLLPLTPKLQQFQNLVKNHLPRQLWLRTTTGNVQVG